MGRKLALVIGNSEYEDSKLAQLVTPGEDVSDLADVLRTSDIGEFDEVNTLVNAPVPVVSRAIGRFFKERSPEDLLLLYFSGHGVRDDNGHLYLAVKDTEHDLLAATAIPAAFITGEMDRSRSRRQVLILDCCHSGAFAPGMKGAVGDSVGTANVFQGTGYGRVVLTASDSTQYAWEGDAIRGEVENSVFTYYMIDGLRTGAADRDADGQITLDELYDYVYEQVVTRTPKQTPGKWSYKQQGEIVLAKNPRPVRKPVELPAELRQAVESPFAGVREGAVRELERVLRSSHPDLADVACEALNQLMEDDSRRVSSAAAQVLADYAEVQRNKKAVEAGAPVRRETEERAHREAEARARQDTERRSRQEAEKRIERAVQSETEAERPVKEAIETPGTGISSDRLIAFARSMWLPILITIVGWMSGWFAAESLWGEISRFVSDNGIPGGDGLILGAFLLILTSLAGTGTALALRRGRPAFQAKHGYRVIGVWVISGLIGWSFFSTDEGLSMALAGALGGLGVGLVLSSIEPALKGPQIVAVAIGWGIARYVGDQDSISSVTNWFIRGGLTGLIGSGVMFWVLNQLGADRSTEKRMTQPLDISRETEQSASVDPVSRVVAFSQAMWFPILLTMIGWGSGWLVGGSVADTIYIFMSDNGLSGGDIVYIAGFLLSVMCLGGVGLAVALRQVISAFDRKRALILIGTLVVSAAIGWGIFAAKPDLFNASVALIGGLSGLGLGLILRKIEPAFQGRQIAVLVSAWAIAPLFTSAPSGFDPMNFFIQGGWFGLIVGVATFSTLFVVRAVKLR